MKTLIASNIESMRSEVMPLVHGKGLADRTLLYTMFRAICIKTMGGQSAPESAQSVTVESGAILGPKIKKREDRQQVLDEFAQHIRAKDWKCDSISAATTLIFSRGFSVKCNHFAYSYEIMDRGGHWVVTLN